jgi:hypothetical protein
MGKLFKACGGRTTLFAFSALLLGAILAYFGKLNSEFVALIGALQTLVIVRAVAQDKQNSAVKSPEIKAT